MAKSVSLLCTISWAYTNLYLQVPWDSSCSPTSACKPRKWRATARNLLFVHKEWVNLFHRPKGPLSKGNSAWSAQLPRSTELSCFLNFIIWWSGSHRVFLRSWQLDWFLAISEYQNSDFTIEILRFEVPFYYKNYFPSLSFWPWCSQFWSLVHST